MEDALKSLKEFIWDIIGYLIPGFLLIIVFNLVILPKTGISNKFFFDWKIFQNYLIVVVSYVLGYVVYGLTIFKKNVQNFLIDLFNIIVNYISGTFLKFIVLNKIVQYITKDLNLKHSKSWENGVNQSATLHAAKDFLKSKNYAEVDRMKMNEVRNILMSRNPTMDQKVYTFMFRSSLFDHISTISILVLIMAFLQYFILDFSILKTDSMFKVFYILLIPIVPLLGNSKRMFYSIAQRLPLSNLN